MKRIFVALFLIICLQRANGQTGDVKVGSPIPTFKMLLTNGKYFTDKDLQKNKPLVLIYFAPDCEHCITLMDQVFKKIHRLDKASVVLITFKAPAEIVPFENKYHTANYPNIKVGTEGLSYVLRNYYRLDKTPFTAVYDKKGKMISSYKNETPVDKMLAQVDKL